MLFRLEVIRVLSMGVVGRTWGWGIVFLLVGCVGRGICCWKDEGRRDF